MALAFTDWTPGSTALENTWPVAASVAFPAGSVSYFIIWLTASGVVPVVRPELWATIDYAVVENPDIRSQLRWTVQRNGTGHGIAAWFETELADGVRFSNAPGEPKVIYGSVFFPWLEPVHLVAGQSLCVDLEAKLLENDYFWRWTTRIESAEKAGETVVRFEQSQLSGAILSPQKLRKRASTYVPQLSEDGFVRRRALDLMDGTASLEEIARQLTAEFPDRFARWERALTFAGTISIESSR